MNEFISGTIQEFSCGFTSQVLLNQMEISGEEIDFILNNYPPQTPVSLLLEEENPGSLRFNKEQGRELEYVLASNCKAETGNELNGV